MKYSSLDPVKEKRLHFGNFYKGLDQSCNPLYIDKNSLSECKNIIYEYRKKRYQLHLDDKILTGWNGLMIAAMCHLYRVSNNYNYINEILLSYSNLILTNQLMRNT